MTQEDVRKHGFRAKPPRMPISVAPAGLEKIFFEIGQSVRAGAMTEPTPTKEEIEKPLTVTPHYSVEINLPP